MDILLYEQGKQVQIHMARTAFPLSVCTVYKKWQRFIATPGIMRNDFGNYQKQMA